MSWKRLSLETPEDAAVEEPVDLDFVKQQLRLQTLDDDDDLVFNLISMAREYVETYTKRSLIARTATAVLGAFPAHEILLPYGAAQSVTSIVYRDSTGTQQTLSGSASPAVFQTDLSDQSHAVLWPLRTETWPSADSLSVDPVTITWEAGYGSAAAVPHMLRLGIARQVAQWYESRSDLEEAAVSDGFRRLLEPYVLTRRV